MRRTRNFLVLGSLSVFISNAQGIIPRDLPCDTRETIQFLPDLRASVNQIFSGQVATFAVCDGKTVNLTDTRVDWGDQTGEFLDLIAGFRGSDNGKVYGKHLFTNTGIYTVTAKISCQCYDSGKSSDKRHWFKASCGTGKVHVYDSTPIKSFSLTSAKVQGGTTTKGTVILTTSAGSVAVLVYLSSSNPSLTPSLPSSVLVDPFAQSTSFDITTAPVGSPVSLTLTAVSGGTNFSQTLTSKRPKLA